MRKKALTAIICCALLPFGARAQQLHFSQQHGFYDQSFALDIIADEQLPAGATIRYTLDSSEPTASSKAYIAPLTVTGTTIVRAAGIADTGRVTPIATATYLFTKDILRQPDLPAGYPDMWGWYTDIWGQATADYGMDSEMTNDAELRPKIAEGLQSLPVVSIVSDKENFFSHELDEERGGIYIYTGPPVGDPTGHGWTRRASVEMFLSGGKAVDGGALVDFSTTCGVRLHGGHGRLAEKNPKHSFRLVFKEEYGPKTLKAPIFGEDEPTKFDQLVLRCHFGNAWQHWDEGNRQKAQYTRDVWARRMQRKMGHESVNARYVNLFLNGMYWGLYNIAERVDDQFGKDHMGGKKSEIDVIKVEEDGGNHLEAAEGDLATWELMTQTAANAWDDKSYEQLDTLLDLDQFIDYMLINQYGGNTDWDHHNWYAIRRHNNDSVASAGFRLLCWDTEIIFVNQNENILSKNNGHKYPTGIFQNLLQNARFARRYQQRAKEVLAEDGLLGEKSVVEVWDSLYNTIHKALYAEAARWGDYRRDVHPWQRQGQLYTVDNQYQTERRRLLTQYFPSRSETVLSQVLNYVGIDDFEAPENWVRLTAQLFKEWDGTGADAQPTGNPVNAEWNLNTYVSGGGVVAGFSSVKYNLFADVSQYDKLVIRGQGNGLRILANRLTDHGPYKQIVVGLNEWDPYWDAEIGGIILPLDDLATVNTNENVARRDAFVHINAMKVQSGGNMNVSGMWLIPKGTTATGTSGLTPHASRQVYDLQGRERKTAYHGLNIVRTADGRVVKVMKHNK